MTTGRISRVIASGVGAAGFLVGMIFSGQGTTTMARAAQAPAKMPDLSGAWGTYSGGRGNQSLAAVAATAPVLKGEYAKRYADRRAAEQQAQQKGEVLGNASTACLPTGVPSMMSVAIYPIEIIQTPKQITIVGEAFSEVRRIYMDKPQEKIEDVPPGYYGRSVGHWEGDTLVVDTVGIKESVTYSAGQNRGIPHSDQMRITERIRLAAADVLHDEIKIEDPLALEKPVTYRLAYSRRPGYEMVEFVCDNNREYVDERGVVHMRLGPDGK